MSKVDNQSSSSVSRRSFLKMMGIGGAGVVIGASGAGSVFSFKSMFDTPEDEEKDAYEFYGKVQAGITTPTQKTCNVVSLELKSKDKSAIKDMFKQWTKMAENMTDGDAVEKDSKNPLLPPVDTGEAIGLGASKLTLTFGVSKSFMKKLGLSDKIRKDYKDLPHFPNDQIDEDYSDGDIMIQACSNDEQVTFHAVHNLIRPFRDLVKVKWSQNGFVSVKGKETPRNLMAFKDGTVNPRKTNEYKDYVFINDGWAKNGTYCIIRRIQIHIETWDRTALEEQEATFGRKRSSGAPLTGKKEFDELDLKAKDSTGEYVIPEDAHARLAREAKTSIKRRAYNYTAGTNEKTGNLETGLLFISFQKSPQQFIDIQNHLGHKDKLNEYITHRGTATFIVLPGVQKGGYLGETLFN
ncbi:deferrochelatase/peroxidase EfeB [Staphylococcus warneri]|uniref:iron uptake transporter deferrochelatase/peroxidase subunit n=1 Tax=Staphylococcus TaxID=1279 RepID=UPI0009522A80|nr:MULTISPECIES: iron uptake transporter deferrochelatase/peroxidase subunit [Staphylococcus]OLS07780.1 peroxidase [Staphylococcus epidermidis]AXV41629.1 TAT-translocated Dyp-type peroxidase [Staphylococcus sp. M0911]MCD8804444.1 deferrochelatase/peroxidase EfeB [Staphylococcus warneri]MCD8806711.1 deferrochelatase/peroxidase EfeB [Staphylococcus warneri]PTI21093.1 deferrochelatase/peroxidase EfeB [Staphylococcus warneri]